MVNRNLKQIANQVGSNKPPRDIPKRTFTKNDGWEYIPSLNLYVSDAVVNKGKSFLTCNKMTTLGKSLMLTPPQFWEYYDHCVDNRPDIIEKLKRDTNEYLNGVYTVDGSLLALNLKYNPDSKTLSAPKIKNIHEYSYPPPGRYFLREGIGKHGYPINFIQGKTEFLHFLHELTKKMCPCILSSTPGKSIGIGFLDEEYENDPVNNKVGGYRPCLTEEKMKELN